MGLRRRHSERKYVAEEKTFQKKICGLGEMGPGKRQFSGRGCGPGKKHSSRKKCVLGDGKGDGVRENMFLEEKTFPMEKVGARRGWS